MYQSVISAKSTFLSKYSEVIMTFVYFPEEESNSPQLTILISFISVVSNCNQTISSIGNRIHLVFLHSESIYLVTEELLVYQAPSHWYTFC